MGTSRVYMAVMIYWLVVLILSLFVALMLARALLRVEGEDDGGADLAVYKDQLKEVDRDVARGTLTEDEAEQVRLEVSRRLLEADKLAQARQTQKAPAGANIAAAAVIGAIVIFGSGLLYFWQGVPWYPDLPLAERKAAADEARVTRMTQAEAEATLPPTPPVDAEAEYLALVAQLREAVTQRPNDLQGHQLLARHEAQLGNFRASHEAQARVIALLGAEARAADHLLHADLLIQSARGFISPEAETAFTTALEMEPENGSARYLKGLLEIQTGRADLAFVTWRDLFEDSRGDEPWAPVIRSQLENLADIAGTEYQLPQIRGPSSADIAAAEGLSEADRAAMINGMVEGLAERLATEGGTPEDWARLIRALGVLGQTERAAAIWVEAQSAFSEAEGLPQIRDAAVAAGVAGVRE